MSVSWDWANWPAAMNGDIPVSLGYLFVGEIAVAVRLNALGLVAKPEVEHYSARSSLIS